MYIYKIINKINGKWYIGKHNGSDPNYMGSGKVLKQAYKKYGVVNFEKVIIETCSTEEELNIREAYWISITNAIKNPESYNLVDGGTGGDRREFIHYNKIDYSKHKCQGATKWYQSLSIEEKIAKHKRTANSTAKDWYVSRIDDPTEVLVHNIAEWCRANGVSTNFPSESTTVGNRLYQKQSKGWRFRKPNMDPLPPYENKRGKIIIENGCKGRTWKIVNGKRVWFDK